MNDKMKSMLRRLQVMSVLVVMLAAFTTASAQRQFAQPKGVHKVPALANKKSPVVDEVASNYSAPEFTLQSAYGEQRTYAVTNTNKNVEGTLYYTTAVSTNMPAKGGSAWKSTTAQQVEVTVSGVGNIYAYFVAAADNQASAVAYQTVNGVVQTLMKPTRDSWGYNAETNEVTVFLTSDQWQIEGNPQPTIYYAIGSGAYQATTEAYVEMVLTVGTIIKYYSHADGFNDSPVTTATVDIPVAADGMEWKEGINFWESTFADGTAVTLGSAVESNLYQIKVDGTVINERLLTPKKNIGSGFVYRSFSDGNQEVKGLYSSTSRTYALTGLSQGGCLYVGTYNSERSADITVGNGLEYKDWNRHEWGDIVDFPMKVTSDGTATFTLNAGSVLQYIDYFEQAPPQPPTFSYNSMSGANRTYTIYNNNAVGTIHYTTKVYDHQPEVGSAAYDGTANGYSVQVTVTGVGRIYAYITNDFGTSEVAYVDVNGVELKLNQPYIDNKYFSNNQWWIHLNSNQNEVEGAPKADIYYTINSSEPVKFGDDYFAVKPGDTISLYTTAEGYAQSDVVTAVVPENISLEEQWSESYNYLYSKEQVALGNQVVSGLYQLLISGSVLRDGHLLTTNENIGSDFHYDNYSGIYSYQQRTYAVTGVTAHQYLIVNTNSNNKVTPVSGAVIDAWNSTGNSTALRATADGTIRFTVSARHYLTGIALKNEPQYGDVSVADTNGNLLIYHYEDPTSPATFTGIREYASDEAKAGHIIIADKVTDNKGKTHRVEYIGSSLNNREHLKSVVFGQNISGVGYDEGGKKANGYTFSYCGELESVTLNASVDSLAQYTFYDCSALNSINTAEATSLTTIGRYCFYDCSSLTELTLTAVEKIGEGAFAYCSSLQSITFGEQLPANAFGTNNNMFPSNLESMTIPGVNYPFARKYSNLPAMLTIYVHPDMVETYKANDFTKDYHIVAIGSTAGFTVTTTADKRIAVELAKLTDNVTDVQQLKVIGPINGTDVQYLHEALPYLEMLDLGEARIVEGGDQYNKWYVSSGKPQKDTYNKYSTQNDSITPYMFASMPLLKSIVLPRGATGMGNYACYYDNKLSSVTLPDGLKNIGNYAFYMENSSNQLTAFSIPGSVTKIGEYAFYYAQLQNIVIPDNVTSIGQRAFYNCQNLQEATLSTALTKIPAELFYNCRKLQKVSMSDNITEIGNYAFYRCTALTTVNIPSKLVTIGQYAFYNNSNLANTITLPATCRTIGNSAFYQCDNLPELVFNDGLTTIGNNAFAYCPVLVPGTLPVSLTSLGDGAFNNDKAIETFTFPGNITVVPNSVLYGCDNLRQVTLADGTTKIGNQSFGACPQLTQMNYNQATLTSIGYNAFQNTGFTEVSLPNGVTYLGEAVFYGCGQLRKVNIPTGVTVVPREFASYCPALTTVTMHDGIREVSYQAFNNCSALADISLNDQITVIGQYAFQNCVALENVNIPANLQTLGSGAFYGSGIKQAVLPSTITSFGTSVFYNCEALESVTLPENLTAIPGSTFRGTKALKSIVLPDGLLSIANYAFYESGLESIELPLSLTTIGQYVFYNTQLEEITVPKNVTSVGSYFAAYCQKLKTAKLGRKMDYSADNRFSYFDDCENLTLLRVYAGTPPAINQYYTEYRTNCVLEVPDGQVEVYKNTDIWKTFKEIRAFESDEMLNRADYLALCDLYNQLGGETWKTKWDVSSRNHSNGKWNGVSTVVDENDDELFYITAIDLTDQGLSGQLPRSVFCLSKLTKLTLADNAIETKVDTLLTEQNTTLTEVNLKGNHLRGDLYKLASMMPNLTVLDVSYNWLTDMSEVMARDKLKSDKFTRGYQFVDFKTKEASVPDDLVETVVIDYTPGQPVAIEPNRLQKYNHDSGNYNLSYTYLYRRYASNAYLYFDWYGGLEKTDGMWNVTSDNVFQAQKGALNIYSPSYSDYYEPIFILRVDWQDGDVNADQTVDVADLQNVIYYALHDAKPDEQFFNFSAADVNADKTVNVSDVVGTVDYVLAYEGQTQAGTPAFLAPRYMVDDSRNILAVGNNGVRLTNNDEVAAIQMTISGANSHQLRVNGDIKSQFSVAMRDTNHGVKVVIYSPEGNMLTMGQHQLFETLPAGAAVSEVRLSDPQARRLGVTFTDNSTTGIEEIDFTQLDDIDNLIIFDLSGRRVGKWNTLPSGVYILNVNGKQFKIRK